MQNNKISKILLIALLLVGLGACAGTPTNYQTVSYSSDTPTQTLPCKDYGSESCVEYHDDYYNDGSETGRLIGAAILQGVVHGVIEVMVHALFHH